MTSSTSTSIVRVHSSPHRHSVPPRSHSSHHMQIADIPVSQLAKNFEVFSEATTDTLANLAACQKSLARIVSDIDQKIEDLVARVRRLENLVGGNIVREGHN